MSYKHTRGDTFSVAGEVEIKDSNGDRILDLTDWTGASQIRDENDELIAELTFTWVDATKSLMALVFEESTDEWKIGRLYTDVQFISPAGDIISSKVAFFDVSRDVTKQSGTL